MLSNIPENYLNLFSFYRLTALIFLILPVSVALRPVTKVIEPNNINLKVYKVNGTDKNNQLENGY